MTDMPVYLDHNATTPVARDVAEAMWPYLTERFGNPSSATVYGRLAREAVDRAREQVAELIGARPDEIVFTSGGTESNNLAIRGAAARATTAVAVTSAIEHPATGQPLAHLREEHGWRVHELPVDPQARVSVAGVPAGPIGLGTLILAHNEIGTIQPVAEVAEAVHAAGGLMHADAAQAVGKIPVSVVDLGVDLLSIAGHKLYAPKGVGALFVRRGVEIAPVLVGAGQERGLRPGTENVAGIVGLGAAAGLASRVVGDEQERQRRLRELLWERLAAAVRHIVRISPTDGALPNTLMVAVPGHLGADILAAVDGVAASTGSACHSGVHTPSAALLAMGVPAETALGALRLSLGRATTADDIERAAAVLIRTVAEHDPDRTLAAHWDAAYEQGETTRSWFEEQPVMSLRMLDAAGVRPDASLIDIGGGASRLVDALLARGHRDLAVLDISGAALQMVRDRLGPGADRVHWIISDIGAWSPGRCFDVWHDRAVLHFLTTAAEQSRYLDTLRAATGPGAVAVFGCFAPEGPTHCSGLPVVRRSAAELAALLGPEWSLVADDHEQHPTPGGGTQPFTWAAFTRIELATSS